MMLYLSFPITTIALHKCLQNKQKILNSCQIKFKPSFVYIKFALNKIGTVQLFISRLQISNYWQVLCIISAVSYHVQRQWRAKNKEEREGDMGWSDLGQRPQIFFLACTGTLPKNLLRLYSTSWGISSIAFSSFPCSRPRLCV